LLNSDYDLVKKTLT